MPDFADQFVFVVRQGEVFHCSHQATTPVTTIGRTVSNEIRLPDPIVSRNHAVVNHERDTWVLRDLTSRNGTFINGQRTQESKLRCGDVIQIGHYELTICRSLRDSGTTGLDLEDETYGLQPPMCNNPPNSDPRPQLSPSRERVYLQLMEGHGAKEIARNLGLSRHTVHWHTRAIYGHFEVSSQAELLAKRLREVSSQPGTVTGE